MARFQITALALLGALAACTGGEEASGGEAPAGVDLAALAPCGGAEFVALIGKPGVELEKASGRAAGDLRLIKPGDMVTEDFRENRLNADLDAAGVITGLRCG